MLKSQSLTCLQGTARAGAPLEPQPDSPQAKSRRRTQQLRQLCLWGGLCLCMVASMHLVPNLHPTSERLTVRTEAVQPQLPPQQTPCGNGKQQVLTHTADQALISEEPDALPEAVFARLQRGVRTSPLRFRKNTLDKESLGKETGWVVYFNIEGAHVLCSSPVFEHVCPFFDAVRLPDANAWVLSLVNSQPAEEVEGARKAAGSRHMDDSLQAVLCPGANAVSHETDMLYVQVPADAEGGQLKVWSRGADSAKPGVAHSVAPAENKVVRFRGDAIHQVLKHQSGTGQERVSLVVEQYKVPLEFYTVVPSFWIKGQSKDNVDLSRYWDSGALPRLQTLPREQPPWAPAKAAQR